MLIFAGIIGFMVVAGLIALNLWYIKARAALTPEARAAEDEAAATETRIW